MSESSDSAGVFYPSNWPTSVDEPHCTLIYLGSISEVSFTKEDVQSVLASVGLTAPGKTRTGDIELFGKDKDIPVVRLDSLLLRVQRKQLELALNQVGIENGSEFKEYKPHVTVDSPKISIPEYVTLEAPVLWWGDDRS